MAPLDPTLDRIRQVRHEISGEAEHDPRKLVEYYARLQERYRERLVGHETEPPADKSAA